MIVYKTTNLINDKVYIGQDSKNNSKYLGSGKYLKNAIKKYGIENFQKETMAICDTKDKLDFLEKFYIDFCKSKVPNGYNITDGGDGGSGLHSEETKKKIGISNIGKRKGIHLSEEIKNKIRKSKIGKFNGGGHFKAHSEETKRKISSKLVGSIPWIKGKHHSIDVREKISNTLMKKRKDKTFSQENE